MAVWRFPLPALSITLYHSLSLSPTLQWDPGRPDGRVLPGRYIETYAQQSITPLPPATIAQSNNPTESLEPFQWFNYEHLLNHLNKPDLENDTRPGRTSTLTITLPHSLRSRPTVYYGARSYIISRGAVKKIQSQAAGMRLTRPLRPLLSTSTRLWSPLPRTISLRSDYVVFFDFHLSPR